MHVAMMAAQCGKALLFLLAISLGGCLYFPPVLTSDIDKSDLSSLQVGVTTRDEMIDFVDAPIIIDDSEYLLVGGEHNWGGILFVIPTVPEAPVGYANLGAEDGYVLATFDRDNVLKTLEVFWDVQEPSKRGLWKPLFANTEEDRFGLRSLAISPDGLWLAGGSGSNVVYVWNLATCKQAVRIEVQSSWWRDHCWVCELAFSPNGLYLAGADFYQNAKVWSTSSWDELLSIEGHDRTRAIAFSLDSTKLATAGEDGLIKLWTIPTGEDIRTLGGHEDRVMDLIFAFDDQYLISAGEDGTVRFWNLASQEPEVYRVGRGMPIVSLDWLEDERQLAIGSEIHVEVWSVTLEPISDRIEDTTSQEPGVRPAHEIRQISMNLPRKFHNLSFGGPRVALSARYDLLANGNRIWSTRERELIGDFAGDDKSQYNFSPNGLVFSPDGSQLYAVREGFRGVLHMSVTNIIENVDGSIPTGSQ